MSCAAPDDEINLLARHIDVCPRKIRDTTHMIKIMMSQDDTPHIMWVYVKFLHLSDRCFLWIECGANPAQKSIS